MATKSQGSPTTKQLRATNEKLRAKLKKADAQAARWEEKAKAHRAVAARAQSRVTKLEKKLSKAHRGDADLLRSPAPAEGVGAPAPTGPDAAPTTAPTTAPDDGWTVVQLRREVRSRGLTGLSRKSKAELVAALNE